MAQTTVRVSETTRNLLRRLAALERRPMQAIIATALESYRRERFLRAVDAGYAALREDAAGWTAVAEERAAWDAALMDGLPDETGVSRALGARRRQRKRGSGG
jgi:predicted transcriptional regulator